MPRTEKQIAVKILEQPAAALAKNYHVSFGFRPSVVWVINYKAAGAMAIKVDGLESATTEGGLSFGANAAIAEVGSDGIFFEENGIQLKADAGLIRDNSAQVVVIAFRDLDGIQTIPVVEKARVSAYGKGKQFGQDASVSDEGLTTS